MVVHGLKLTSRDEKSRIKRLFTLQILDKNKSGVIEFDEFAKLMEERVNTRQEQNDEVFLEAFKVFDKDDDGKISAEELRYELAMNHS